MTKVYDVLFKRGETDEGRGIWIKCGVMLEKPDGKKSIKVDAVPGWPWLGWVACDQRAAEERWTECAR